MITSEFLDTIETQSGRKISTISKEKTILLVFLRHFGCIFCKEALKDLSKKRESLTKRGIELVFVHMSDEDTAIKYFNNYGLKGVESIADPMCKLYESFGLVKGNFSQLFGLKNWVRGFQVVSKDPSMLSLKQIGDGFQMPGIFLIKESEIKESFVHNSAADRPDYDALIDCCAA
jgi:peroxiredoxin